MPLWNPWHGCTKCSPGCRNCYVYRRDAEFGKDASIVKKTASFNLPVYLHTVFDTIAICRSP